MSQSGEKQCRGDPWVSILKKIGAPKNFQSSKNDITMLVQKPSHSTEKFRTVDPFVILHMLANLGKPGKAFPFIQKHVHCALKLDRFEDRKMSCEKNELSLPESSSGTLH